MNKLPELFCRITNNWFVFLPPGGDSVGNEGDRRRHQWPFHLRGPPHLHSLPQPAGRRGGGREGKGGGRWEGGGWEGGEVDGSTVCNLLDYPIKVGFRIFCWISSDYEEYARSLSDFNISDPKLRVMRHAKVMAKRIFFETYDVSPPVGWRNANNCYSSVYIIVKIVCRAPRRKL